MDCRESDLEIQQEEETSFLPLLSDYLGPEVATTYQRSLCQAKDWPIDKV